MIDFAFLLVITWSQVNGKNANLCILNRVQLHDNFLSFLNNNNFTMGISLEMEAVEYQN